MLIFNQDKLDLSSCRGHIFTHELFIGVDGITAEGISNTVMLLERGDPMLDIYIAACLAKLRELPEGPVPRTALGPALLTELAEKNDLKMLHGIGLFTPALLREIAAYGGPLTHSYLQRLPELLVAANLCHFLCNEITPAQRPSFDALYDRAVDRLIRHPEKLISRQSIRASEAHG